VDKLFYYTADLFQDYTKVSLIKIRFIKYLSKLYPTRPNTEFCTILVHVFKCLCDSSHFSKYIILQNNVCINKK